MKKTKRNKLKYWLIGIGVFLASVIFCLWPTKYIIEAPGEVDSISQFVEPKKYANPNFYLVTISQRPAVMIDYLTSFLRKYDTRYTKDELMGDASSAEYNQMQQYYMETSQNNAIYYAAKKANVKAERKYLGVYVMNIMDNSTFKNKLKIGDIVDQVNDKKFKSTKELMKYVNSLPRGSKITVSVIRKGKALSFTGKTVKLSNSSRSGIGIGLVDHTYVKTDPKLTINADDIGGPSAGLMFTLECYQIFTKTKLSNAKIAGTGTIDAQGKVGIIGGVDKKVVAADKAGMKVFFAPTDQPAGVKNDETNYAEAKRTAKEINSKMKIVPVSNFEDALKYLQNHKIK